MPIGRIVVRNRLVRAATAELMGGERGEVTDGLIDLHVKLARGGVGLQILGHAFVEPRGQGHPHQTGVYDDSHIPGLRRLAEAVHDNGGIIFGEVNHSGAKNRINPEEARAPSEVQEPQTGNRPKELSSEEVWEIVARFGDAARRVKEAGFDGLHVHGANGYLISQFGSPYSNTRTDEWGGSAEKRSRFLVELYRDIRKKVGRDFPVTLKLGVADHVPGGLTVEEGVERAALLESEGVAAIEVSCGVMPLSTTSAERYVALSKARAVSDLALRRLFAPATREAYFLAYARAVKRRVRVPVILVGGIRKIETMEEIVRNGDADFLSMARPFIREPDLAKQIQNGRRGLVDCTSCNLCLNIGVFGLRCWRKNKIRLLKASYYQLKGSKSN